METNLVALNQKIALMEQQRGRKARQFFADILSDKLLFRCPNGKVIGKADFLERLESPSPFTEYNIEYLRVTSLAGTEKRSLVTMIVRTCDRYSAVRCFRNIRLFTRTRTGWKLEFWYNYEDVNA